MNDIRLQSMDDRLLPPHEREQPLHPEVSA